MKRAKRFLLFAGIGMGVVAVIAFMLAWPQLRWLTEFELDENSFDAAAMAEIEEFSGIDFPDEARGLRFHYSPPIDPVYIAEIEVPKEFLPDILKALEEMNDDVRWASNEDYHAAFGWPPAVPPTDLILTKRLFQNSAYLEVFLEDRGDVFVVYLDTFTM